MKSHHVLTHSLAHTTPSHKERELMTNELCSASYIFSALKKPMNSTSFYKHYSLTSYEDIIIGL